MQQDGSMRLLILLFLLLLMPVHLQADDKIEAFESQNEKESYSIGYQVGISIKVDGVEVDFNKLILGLHDALDGKEPLLDVAEMKKLIVNLKQEARKTQLRKIQESIVQNAEESKKFLEENAKKEGVKTTDSGLQYIILNEGEGLSPELQDQVTVHYRGTFIDGKEFDNSYAKGEPQTMQTDAVIKGWTEAIRMMKAGSKWKIFLPPELAYGRSGLGEKIPPNKVLVFELELLAIEKKKDEGK